MPLAKKRGGKLPDVWEGKLVPWGQRKVSKGNREGREERQGSPHTADPLRPGGDAAVSSGGPLIPALNGARPSGPQPECRLLSKSLFFFFFASGRATVRILIRASPGETFLCWRDALEGDCPLPWGQYQLKGGKSPAGGPGGSLPGHTDSLLKIRGPNRSKGLGEPPPPRQTGLSLSR